MNLQKVHPNDLRKAINLYECCFSCLNRARMEMYRDNLDECERWMIEFQRCKKELDQMVERKKLKDRMEKLVNDMQEQGYNVEIITRKGRGLHAN
ncbi:hypothetical protein ACQCU1_12475 [Sutcliffiella horikoshii]|uniref:hypothetical protein n=1 Tax=Sutcliffiella horikoshii TaxID=79883 RepID=UPI003CEB6E1E